MLTIWAHFNFHLNDRIWESHRRSAAVFAKKGNICIIVCVHSQIQIVQIQCYRLLAGVKLQQRSFQINVDSLDIHVCEVEV